MHFVPGSPLFLRRVTHRHLPKAAAGRVGLVLFLSSRIEPLSLRRQLVGRLRAIASGKAEFELGDESLANSTEDA